MVNIKFTGLISLIGIIIICYCFFNIITPENVAPENKNSIKGYILNISSAQQNNNSIIGSVLIEGTVNNYSQSTHVSFTITEKTEILKHQNSENYLITFDELKQGQSVEITSTQPMLMSYPAQSNADKIVVLEN